MQKGCFLGLVSLPERLHHQAADQAANLIHTKNAEKSDSARREIFYIANFLKQRSNSPSTPSKVMLDQIIKGFSQALHHPGLVVNEKADIRTANENKRQKRTRSTSRLLSKGAYQSKRAYG
jgi:galactose-1-phosphate uridylyltransferase